MIAATYSMACAPHISPDTSKPVWVRLLPTQADIDDARTVRPRVVLTPSDGSAHALIALTGPADSMIQGELLLLAAMPKLIELNAIRIGAGLEPYMSDDCLAVAAPSGQWSN